MNELALLKRGRCNRNSRTKRSMLFLGICLLGMGSLPAVGQETAWVLTTDYSTFGRIREFAMDSPWTVSDDLATIPGDATGRHHDDLVYVVGRSNANLIQIYDPAAGFSLVREFSLGTGLNPQDIAFDAQGDAYVSCYDQAVLLRVDVDTGQVLDTFDTSIFADADGMPETAWIQMLGDRLYITCQKLDRDYYYAPTGPGALLVFDTINEQWVDMDAGQSGIQPITLQGGDPYTRIEVFRSGADGPYLRVGCVGFYGLQDGGLEQVDPETGLSMGYLVTEEDLGGDIIGYTGTGAGSVHVLVSNSSFQTSLRSVDLNTGLVTVLDSSGGYDHADIAYDGEFQLYLADRTLGASGLRVFDTVSGAELTTGAISTGLPPFQFVMPFNGGFSPVTGPLPALGELNLAAAYPNPCNPTATFEVSGSPGGRVQVRVLDLRGRLLRDEVLVLDASGLSQYRFTGRDGSGRDLASGVYRVTAQSSAGFAVRSVTLLK